MKKLFTTVLFAACTLAASANDYYVSVEGAGNGDGTSLANAWSVAKLEEKCTSGNNNFNNGDKIHLAAGTYAPTATLFFNMGVKLIGAEGADRTVFTGDTNNDGVAERNGLFKILTESEVDRPVTIENIDFENFKLDQPKDLNSDNSNGVGVFWMYKCISTVTLNNCNFKNITNAGHGGSAIFAKRSNIVLNNCTFKNISALARGVVIRLTSDENHKGTTTLNNCVFEACKATTADKTFPCGLVMLQHGETLTVVNSVFKNNVDSKGKGGALWIGKSESNYKRELIVNNCLMFNNSADNAPAIFFNDASKSVTYTNCKMDDASAVVMPSINVSSVEAATYYVGAPFTMPEGLTGKTFAAVEENMLGAETVYEAGAVVPAGTALLIEGAEGTYNPVLAETTEQAPVGNLLKGADVTATTTGGESYYKLADGDNGLGFYWADPNGAFAFESAAHKAYLCLNTAGARKAFFFNGETTGIESLNGSNGSSGSNGASGANGVKVLKNGRFVIEKGGKTYNAVGAEVM